MSIWNEGVDLPEPLYVRESPMMAGALMSLCGYLWEQPDAHEAFCRDTGAKRLPPAKSALEHLIDQATGAGDDYARDFIAWVIRTQWGEASPTPATTAPLDGSSSPGPPETP